MTVNMIVNSLPQSYLRLIKSSLGIKTVVKMVSKCELLI
jgi:hypothetical protein